MASRSDSFGGEALLNDLSSNAPGGNGTVESNTDPTASEPESERSLWSHCRRICLKHLRLGWPQRWGNADQEMQVSNPD